MNHRLAMSICNLKFESDCVCPCGLPRHCVGTNVDRSPLTNNHTFMCSWGLGVSGPGLAGFAGQPSRTGGLRRCAPGCFTVDFYLKTSQFFGEAAITPDHSPFAMCLNFWWLSQVKLRLSPCEAQSSLKISLPSYYPFATIKPTRGLSRAFSCVFSACASKRPVTCSPKMWTEKQSQQKILLGGCDSIQSHPQQSVDTLKVILGNQEGQGWHSALLIAKP